MRQHQLSAIIEHLVRGGALFLGSYFLWSWLLYFAGPMRYDATIWWMDLRLLPGPIGVVFSLTLTWALLHRAVFSNPRPRVNWFRSIVLWSMVAVLVMNTFTAWSLHRSRSVASPEGIGGVLLGMPVPLTAVLAVGVLVMIRRPARRTTGKTFFSRARRSSGIVFVAAGFALLAALTQMFWFGESDYRRPADAILVYGCKAHPDGTPSQALADRVHTACELYRQGLAPILVMSGGPVRNAEIHEPQAMADYAVSLGVPREAILLDPHGLDTQATAENLQGLLAGVLQNESPRILAVSHDYHLPRVKLSLERQGLTAYTVPCEIRRSLPSKPYLIARETAAWWYYFFQPMMAQGN